MNHARRSGRPAHATLEPGWLRTQPGLSRTVFYVVTRALRLFPRPRMGGAHPARAFHPVSNHQSYLALSLIRRCRSRPSDRSGWRGRYPQTPFMQKVARFTSVIPVDADANLRGAMKAGAAVLRWEDPILFPGRALGDANSSRSARARRSSPPLSCPLYCDLDGCSTVAAAGRCSGGGCCLAGVRSARVWRPSPWTGVVC
jgi:hypothetical protein